MNISFLYTELYAVCVVGKYRKEFERTFSWCIRGMHRNSDVRGMRTRASSTYMCHFTAVTGSITTPKTEVFPFGVGGPVDID